MSRFLQKLPPKRWEALIYKEFDSTTMKGHERNVSLVMHFRKSGCMTKHMAGNYSFLSKCKYNSEKECM